MSGPHYTIHIDQLLVDRGTDHQALVAEIEREVARLLASSHAHDPSSGALTHGQRVARAVYDQIQRGDHR